MSDKTAPVVAYQMSYGTGIPLLFALSLPEFVRDEGRAKKIMADCNREFGENQCVIHPLIVQQEPKP